MAHTLQERYASILDAKLRKTLVTKDGYIFNNKYEGSPIAGAVKIPVRDAEMAVTAYNKEGGQNLASSSTGYITVYMEDYAVNELIDGYDAAAVPDNLVADRLDSAGYSLANYEDTQAIKVLVNAAEGKDETNENFTGVRAGKRGELKAVALTKENAFETIMEMSEYLDGKGVPNEGRFLIASPKGFSAILQDDGFIKKGDLSQELVMAGAVGEIAGFTVFKSAKTGTASDGKAVNYIAGHPNWCTRVEEWSVMPAINDIKDGRHIGASAVQGRKVGKHAVTKPETICVVTANA